MEHTNVAARTNRTAGTKRSILSGLEKVPVIVMIASSGVIVQYLFLLQLRAQKSALFAFRRHSDATPDLRRGVKLLQFDTAILRPVTCTMMSIC